MRRSQPDPLCGQRLPVCGYSLPKLYLTVFGNGPTPEVGLLPAEKDFSAERTHELAVYSFQRAIICSFINQEKEVIKGGALFAAGMDHRFAGEEDDEKSILVTLFIIIQKLLRRIGT